MRQSSSEIHNGVTDVPQRDGGHEYFLGENAAFWERPFLWRAVSTVSRGRLNFIRLHQKS
jgi:hypothetical protein